jgi:hypothetical protein
MPARQPKPRPVPMRRPAPPPTFKSIDTSPRWKNYPFSGGDPSQKGRIVIQSAFGVAVECWLDESMPTISGGEGIYDEIERPKRKAAIHWNGSNLLRMTVGCILDRFSTNQSIEPEIAKVEMLPKSRGPVGTPPPPVRIAGPVPHQHTIWFVESIEWGDSIWDGVVRQRQQFTLSLVERMELNVALKRQVKPVTGKYGTYHLKKGETLKEVAKKKLGSASKWTLLRNKNGKRFLKNEGHAVGTIVKYPTS